VIVTVDSVLEKLDDSLEIEEAGVEEGILEFCVFPFDRLESVVWEDGGIEVVPVFVCWLGMCEMEEEVASDISVVFIVLGLFVFIVLLADCAVSEDCVNMVGSSVVEGSSSVGTVSTLVAVSTNVSPIEVSVGEAGEVNLPAGVIFASFALVVTFNCRFFPPLFL
jgi:hypothetical protein